ncbi:MAG: metal ABC transporter substrate-binding protein, partial [Christensenellaceae bacterium]|nr:metal ABC transporter substrate-binding protein [Christensenellaceae bacterium]
MNTNAKKILALVLGLTLSLLLLAGCASPSPVASDATEAPTASPEPSAEATPEATEEVAKEPVTLVIGASPVPHAAILNAVKEALAAEGIVLDIREFTDYVQPNLALESGDLDANYFQHLPYLVDFNANNNTHLVSAAAIHYEPFGIYPGKTASLEALADGAQVAVPNDTTNEARALLLLEAQGFIKLAEGVGLEATVKDIVENPKNLKIVEIEAAQVPRSLPDVDIAVINGNYALDAG